jgi:hypothetical protein
LSPQSRKALLIAIAVLALGAAAALLLTRSDGEASYPSKFVTHAVDLANGAEAELELRQGERPPYANPSTGERTMFQWYYCAECNKRFVPPPQRGPDGLLRLPMIPNCPGCGNAGELWSPEDESQAHPAGDHELPKLPA